MINKTLIILLFSLSTITAGCSAPKKQDNLPLTENTVTLGQNTGADALVVNTPKNKPQGADVLVPSSYVKITATNNSSVQSLNNNQYNGRETDVPSMLFREPSIDEHTKLRLLEKELLAKTIASSNGKTNRAVMKAEIPQTFYKKGETYTFNTLFNDAKTVKAICIDNATNAYYFIEENDQSQLTQELLNSYKSAFNAISPKVTHDFGPSGDVDKNGKILILFYNMTDEPGVIGYFYSADKYPKSEEADSNQADMFYMNTSFINEPNTVMGTLAHELQHMTYFNNMFIKITQEGVPMEHYEDDTWLNEGLSMLSSYFCGYADKGSNNDNWIARFLSGDYATLSLTYWTGENYGYSALFTQYFYDKFGKDGVKNIYKSGYGGIKAVEAATKMDFNDFFNDFSQALYLSNDDNATKYDFGSVDIQSYQNYSGKNGLNYHKIMETGNPAEIHVPFYGVSLLNIAYPTPSVTFSYRGDILGYVYPLEN